MIDPYSRRDFLAWSASAAAASALAGTAASRAANAGPNERIGLGLIGCGGIMNVHAAGLVARQSPVTFVGLCDVDPAQVDRIAGPIEGFQSAAPRRTSRYEELLEDPAVDAVIIATPHHWHAPITLAAIAAGKDVYVEKPISHVLHEGRLIRDAARAQRRVVQHGSQMRSSPVTALAGQLLDQGVLGDVRVTKAWNVQSRGTRDVVADSDSPQGVDYDRWLGPAPVRPFNVNRFHGNWRVYRDYGNGDIGDDGIHDIDMAAWGLRVTTHPVQVTAHGSTLLLRGDREYPDNMNVSYQYADGKVLIYEDRLFTPYGLHGFDSGNAFYGTEGYMIFSRRGYFQVYLGPKEEKGPGVPPEVRRDAGRGYAQHMENFLECVRSREQTNCPPEVAHLSCSLVHLGEIAYRTRTVVQFDPDSEAITNNDEAHALLTKNYRAPYGLPSMT